LISEKIYYLEWLVRFRHHFSLITVAIIVAWSLRVLDVGHDITRSLKSAAVAGFFVAILLAVPKNEERVVIVVCRNNRIDNISFCAPISSVASGFMPPGACALDDQEVFIVRMLQNILLQS
jgi:tryptophan synthase alpha subunit